MTDEQLQAIMGLIVNSGNAKSCAMEAINAAKEKDVDLAKIKLDEAHRSLVQAHHMQTNMLTNEASGENFEITLLTIHSQDHLMTSITFTDMAEELVEVYSRLDAVT